MRAFLALNHGEERGTLIRARLCISPPGDSIHLTSHIDQLWLVTRDIVVFGGTCQAKRSMCLPSKLTFFVISTQHSFRNYFKISPLGCVPNRKSILRWITTCKHTTNVLKRRTGIIQLIKTPRNDSAICTMFWAHSGHVTARSLSDHSSVRRTLHEDFHYHPCKLAIV